MIGNPNWFNIRKYTGWGLTPNCWQGWLYVIIFIIPIAVVDSINLDSSFKSVFIGAWTVLLLIDVFHMMTQIKKDERERIHEAIADRNALWFMILVLIIYAFIKQSLDPVFLVALIGAAVVKTVTQIYLRDK
jgi:K+ transporter